MENEFVIFHKFSDYETLKDFSELLTNMGIENRQQSNNQAYVSVVGYNQIDIPFGVNIRQKDFLRAEELLNSYYTSLIPDIDKEYYLFSESNDELLKIVNHPYDFGKLDLVLAKHILNERGINITDTDIQKSKSSQLTSEKKIIPISNIKIIAGYILAIIFPIGGIILGISIYYNRTLLPNGERFYLHSTADRQHGKNIIIICIAWIAIFFIMLVKTQT